MCLISLCIPGVQKCPGQLAAILIIKAQIDLSQLSSLAQTDTWYILDLNTSVPSPTSAGPAPVFASCTAVTSVLSLLLASHTSPDLSFHSQQISSEGWLCSKLCNEVPVLPDPVYVVGGGSGSI